MTASLYQSGSFDSVDVDAADSDGVRAGGVDGS